MQANGNVIVAVLEKNPFSATLTHEEAALFSPPTQGLLSRRLRRSPATQALFLGRRFLRLSRFSAFGRFFQNP
jgi:hypothetical protein